MARAQRHPQRWLVIMAKTPRLGAVKTRLGRDIGAVAAARFHRVTSANVIRRLAADPRWRSIVAVAPDRPAGSRHWPARVPVMGQGAGDLGARMRRIMRVMPPGPVIIVGTDIPALMAAHVARAFKRLGGYDAVLGPAGDGGYWLAGLRRSPRVLDIFNGVRWSSPQALSDTVANLKGRTIGFADELRDVDEAESYRRHGGAGARVIPPLRYRLSW